MKIVTKINAVSLRCDVESSPESSSSSSSSSLTKARDEYILRLRTINLSTDFRMLEILLFMLLKGFLCFFLWIFRFSSFWFCSNRGILYHSIGFIYLTKAFCHVHYPRVWMYIYVVKFIGTKTSIEHRERERERREN